MDVSIPLLDGWEAARIIKAERADSHVPIVMLTAHVLASDRARVDEVGCDGFLAKPVSPSEVLAEVTRRLGSAHAPGR